ncbi:hypothetical protein [uncultured Microbacterium sp.]|nr:hypothetical protein [uncultured Microbacterium sp.]
MTASRATRRAPLDAELRLNADAARAYSRNPAEAVAGRERSA